ncbi:trimethylguanosine synthase [Gossypium hirsutum]|uniref:Trimethylguanosine synthase n=1 Tax=Gossypium hirsutum TaxID=3635 RepID=A0ABM3AWB9_GOSHI|nr:trimethylguanosine synthase-like [Gossypium hirsutum]
MPSFGLLRSCYCEADEARSSQFFNSFHHFFFNFILFLIPVKKNWKKRGKEKGIITPLIENYWFQRYHLFSKYDEGIKMDEEGWFSVAPVEIAMRHAEKCGGYELVIDCFSDVGGNAIQFAKLCPFVLAIDIDPQKVNMVLNNAKVYGVEDNIDFIVGDFFQLAPSFHECY